MAKSSIHIASGKAGYFAHNSRERQTKNSIFHDEQNFCSCSKKEAFEIYKSELAKRSEAYTNRTGQKLQKKAITHLSAIVNLNKEHTEKDLKKVCDYLEQTFDTKVIQYSIHRDEGHIDENGTAHKNYHAHIEFLGLDSEGKSIRRKLTKKALIDLQDKVAELLQMKRGVNYTKERKRRQKRLDTYEYKAHKEQEQKQVLAKQKDLKEQMKELREQLKQAHAERKDYAKLEQLNRELKEQIKAKDLLLVDLQQQLQEYKQQNIDIKLAKLPPLEVDEIEISSGLFKKETLKVYNIESVNKLQKQAQKLHKQAEFLQKSSHKEVPELREKLEKVEQIKETYFKQAYERRQKIEQIEQELEQQKEQNKYLQKELDSVENIDIVATDETREALDIVQNETQEYIASYDTKNAVQKIASFFVKFYHQAKKRIESLLSENKRLKDKNIELQEKIAQRSNLTTDDTYFDDFNDEAEQEHHKVNIRKFRR